MGSLDGKTLHYNQLLSSIVVKYSNHELIADALSPVALVDAKSDDYAVLPEENEMRDLGDLEASASGDVAEMEIEHGTDTFKVRGRSLIGLVPGEYDEHTELPINLRATTGRAIAARLWLRREARIADLVQTAANYPSGNVLTVVDKWDDPTKNPLIPFRQYSEKLYPAADAERVLWMGHSAWTALTLNPFIMDTLKAGGSNDDPAMANQKAVARLAGVDRVVVGKAYRITSNPAKGTTKVRTRIWGNNAGILCVPKIPSQQAIGFSQTFRWNNPTSVNGISLFQGFDAKKGTLGVHWQKMTHFDGEKIVAGECGVLFNAVTT